MAGRVVTDAEPGPQAPVPATSAPPAPAPDPSAPVLLRPGLGVVVVRALGVELDAPALPDHAVYVNSGPPYRLVETLDGVVAETRGAPGDVAVVPAGAVLTTRSRDGSPQRVESLAFLCAPTLVAEVLDAAGGRRHGDGLQPTVGARSPRVAQLAGLVGTSLPDRTDLGRLALESLGDALAVAVVSDHLASRRSGVDRPPPGLTRVQLARVLQHIEDDLAAPLTVADLAAVAHVSPFHFTRLFRASTGASPHRYVVQRRVARAHELLLGTSLPLAQVAARSGFADQSHLTRVLRHHLGGTPAALRAAAAPR